jgi:hypothetical protein
LTTRSHSSRVELQSTLSTVLTAFWYEVDHNAGARASDFFTPDAQLRFEDASFVGTAEIDEVYRQRSARGPRVSRHLVTNLHLLDVEQTRVRSLSALLLFAEDGEPPRPKTSASLVADVWDEFELIDDSWLIRSRWIKNLFLASSADLAVPIQ